MAATKTTVTPSSTVEPCALVASAYSSQKATAITWLPTPTVPAQLAYECMNSVPLHKSEAIDLVDSIVPYLEWQSDLAYKADPPADYPYAAHDIFAALAQVRANLQDGKYANEYQFQEDLYMNVFGPAHDGHLVFYPDALTRVFEFARERALVSISEDGTSLPVIKLYEDVISSPETASVVKLINGIDAATYISDEINAVSYNQDPDAAYNSMFYEKASFAAYGSMGDFASNTGRNRFVYHGPNTTFTFENGTVFTIENTAFVKEDMAKISNGHQYYAQFCKPKAYDDTWTWAKAGNMVSNTNINGYPEPVVLSEQGSVSGYYLDGEGLDDVAVIALLDFQDSAPFEFQWACEYFLARAVADGKTKLVVDFQGNTGGVVLEGIDFFRQLFPSIVQDGFAREKESDSYVAVTQIVSRLLDGHDPYKLLRDWLNPPSENMRLRSRWLIDASLTSFNWRYDYNITNQPFTSWEDKFAPHVYKNTPYSSIMRWNLDDNLTTTNYNFGVNMQITGYGERSNVSQPFAAENVVILHDGICASTCALVAEWMHTQAGVKSVAMGGRPIEGPIQGVGGVKGAQVLSFEQIYNYVGGYLPEATTWQQKAALRRFSLLPVKRSTAAKVNFRNQIRRDNLNDGIPAQFVTEMADCRLYWTLPMINDVRGVWKAAANAAFNGGECAFGGITPAPVKRAGPASKEGTEKEIQRREEKQSEAEKIRARHHELGQSPPVHDLAWEARHRLKAVH
ncbi:hypothetical protein QBC46DRAFT_307694 [Diplogelasinospora grovesii]|uniref:CPAF-like PDZ domain-containing protein n=1 Tax=Diplogelasinospora grovesii TaxID=303347 RepID=A0AAN6NCJ7_9PEZI|nr:hypothetical protein QBC46DRAFT_307694 [Diplogelasinospora grovesii]